MELLFVILSLAGLAMVLKLSQREEKRYHQDIAECRARLAHHLGRDQGGC